MLDNIKTILEILNNNPVGAALAVLLLTGACWLGYAAIKVLITGLITDTIGEAIKPLSDRIQILDKDMAEVKLTLAQLMTEIRYIAKAVDKL